MIDAASATVSVVVDGKTVAAFDAAVGWGQNVPAAPPSISHLVALKWLSEPSIRELVTSACPPLTLPVQTSQFAEMMGHLPLNKPIAVSASAERRGDEIILSYQAEDCSTGVLFTRGKIGFICVPQARMAKQLQ